MDVTPAEKHWLDRLAPGNPDAQVYRELALEVRDLVVAAHAKAPEALKPWRESDFLPRLMDMVTRRGIYLDLLKTYAPVMTGKRPPAAIVTRQHAAYVFTPLLLQSLEGPVKLSLRALWFLFDAAQGKPRTWKWNEHNERYLGSAIDAVAKRCTKGSQLAALVESFNSEAPPMKRVRRALAHSDFAVMSLPDDTYCVVFFDNDDELALPVEMVMAMLHSILDTELPLHAGFHLGLCRIDGADPFLPETTQAAK
jgi:hypothetical protein